MQEKKMPCNLDAEQSVLGAMFLSKYALQKAVETLNKDLFYSEANGKIFEVMSLLAEQNIPIDATTVTSELENKNILSQVGGVEYITDIINTVPSAVNIDEYIKIVEEKAIRRRLIDTSAEIATEGYNSQNDISEILDNAEKKILNVVKSKKGQNLSQFKKFYIKHKMIWKN